MLTWRICCFTKLHLKITLILIHSKRSIANSQKIMLHYLHDYTILVKTVKQKKNTYQNEENNLLQPKCFM